MSSLLQFNGEIERKRGVGLLFYLEREEPWLVGDLQLTHKIDAETETCTQCGKAHAKLYRAWRKPVGMFGCWVVFRYNGKKNIPDLSVPIGVDRLPRGAEPLSADAAAAYWHS